MVGKGIDWSVHDTDGYAVNFRRMFGNERMDVVIGSVDGSVRFYGLMPEEFVPPVADPVYQKREAWLPVLS